MQKECLSSKEKREFICQHFIFKSNQRLANKLNLSRKKSNVKNIEIISEIGWFVERSICVIRILALSYDENPPTTRLHIFFSLSLFLFFFFQTDRSGCRSTN